MPTTAPPSQNFQSFCSHPKWQMQTNTARASIPTLASSLNLKPWDVCGNSVLHICNFIHSRVQKPGYKSELKHKDLLSSVLHSVKSAPNGEAFAYWWPANWSLDRWDPAVQIAHNRPNVNAVYNISSLSLLRILDLWIEMKLWRLQMISGQKRWSALTKWSYPFSSPPIPFHSDCHLFLSICLGQYSRSGTD